MTRILVVEDDPSIRMGLEDTLTAKGYEVDVVAKGGEGAERATSGRYDLVVLDVMLPDIDGFEVCRRIRQSRGAARTLPVIILSARGAELDRVRGLELGADDYVTKPFSPAELVARVKAVLRRTDGPAAPEIVHVGRATIDVGRREVRVGDTPVPFTTKEFELLRFLAERPGLALSRQQILDGVWGYDWYGDARTVDVHLGQVRKKLDGAVRIDTVRGVGYRLEPS